MGVKYMKCPSCNADNNDGAKFCKKCGEPLKKKVISHESMINSMNEEKSSNNTKIIIAVLIIIAVVLAGSLLYIYGFNNNASDSNVQQQADAQDDISDKGFLRMLTLTKYIFPVQQEIDA